ncbi:hypothetical protein [Flavicella sp.]|uniref:hypothetical protein n=1 Tax=Flavicella sp. TaxID=2957742 RepID=UPI003019F3FE
MKKIGFKLLVAFVFSVFGVLGMLLFSNKNLINKEMFIDEGFWVNYLICFLIGYILLGNMLWNNVQKNKLNKN